MTDRIVVVKPEPEKVTVAAAGVRGPAGAEGPAGPEGPQGPKGDPGEVTQAELDAHATDTNLHGGGGGGGATELIASVTLAERALSIDLVDIPQTYRHLRLVFEGRTIAGGTLDALAARCNDDTAANYDAVRMFANGGTPSGGQHIGETFGRIAVVSAASAEAGHTSVAVVDIPNYTGASVKGYSAQSFASHTTGSNGMFLQQTGGRWKNTAAVTRLSVLSASLVSLEAGSAVWLYGIKD